MVRFFGSPRRTKYNLDFCNLRVSTFKNKVWWAVWISSFCPKLSYFADQNGPKEEPHENEFWQFSKTKMSVTNTWSGKIRWKNRFICLASMFPSWVMALKLSKKVHFCNSVLASARNLSLLKQCTYMHLKVLITLFQKMIWFWGTNSPFIW